MRAQLLIKKSDFRSGKSLPSASANQKKRDLKAESKDEERKLEVSDYVLQNEYKLHSRSTIL